MSFLLVCDKIGRKQRGNIMKVLSIKEPYATLICNREKHIETRSWKTSYRGELYIHASIGKAKKELEHHPYLKNYYREEELNYGYIICSCKLVDCVYMDEEYVERMKTNKEYTMGIFEVGRYAWILEEIKPLTNKIKAKGKLNIWEYKEEDSHEL